MAGRAASWGAAAKTPGSGRRLHSLPTGLANMATAVVLSNNDREFILKAALCNTRLDGRQLKEARPVRLEVSANGSACVASLGATRASARVGALLRAPRGARSSEGSLRIRVCGGFDGAEERQGSAGGGGVGSTGVGTQVGVASDAILGSGGGGGGGGGDRHAGTAPVGSLLARRLEAALRDARAVDLEALSVAPGRAAWDIELAVSILSDDGSAGDAAMLASLVALSTHRRAEIAARAAVAPAPGTTGAAAAAPGEPPLPPRLEPDPSAEPRGLTLHHLPFEVSFATLREPRGGAGARPRAGARGPTDPADPDPEAPALLLVDPSAEEEAACGCVLRITLTPSGEVLGVSSGGGSGLPLGSIRRAVQAAVARAEALEKELKRAVAEQETRRRAALVRRHGVPSEGGTAPAPTALTRSGSAASSSGPVVPPPIASLSIADPADDSRPRRFRAALADARVKEEEMREADTRVGGDDEGPTEGVLDGEDADEGRSADAEAPDAEAPDTSPEGPATVLAAAVQGRGPRQVEDDETPTGIPGPIGEAKGSAASSPGDAYAALERAVGGARPHGHLADAVLEPAKKTTTKKKKGGKGSPRE